MKISPSPDKKMLQKAVHKALRNWHKVGGNEEDLLSFLLVVRAKLAELPMDESPVALRQTTNDILLNCLNDMQKHAPDDVKLLQERFDQNLTISQIALDLRLSEDMVNIRQRKAIEQLTNVLYGRETTARKQHVENARRNVPKPSYSKFFGLEEVRSKILQQLLSEESPWVITMVGIGGIGKTSLTHDLVEKVLEFCYYRQIVWLRLEHEDVSGTPLNPEVIFYHLLQNMAKQMEIEVSSSDSEASLLEALAAELKSRPYLVVFDDLETDGEMAYIQARLKHFIGPSRVILTSRSRPEHQADIFVYFLSELPIEDVIDLAQYDVATTGLADQISVDDIKAIYEVIGGNPLALKLVIGLLDQFDLNEIITGLLSCKSDPIEKMYLHIYWQAWRTLSPIERSFLQVMPLIAESGAPMAQLQAVSGMSNEDLTNAILRLSARSLLEIRGTIWDKRYGIHRLTETFLRTEIVELEVEE